MERRTYPDTYPWSWHQTRPWNTQLQSPIEARIGRKWEDIAEAHFHKFADGESSVDVIAAKTVADEVAGDGVRHRTREFVTRMPPQIAGYLEIFQSTLPWLFNRVLGAATIDFAEDAAIDHARRQMHLRSQNITFAQVGYCEEESVFVADPDDPEATLFRQFGGCSITAGALGPLRVPLERFITGLFQDHGVRVLTEFQRALEREDPPL